jgi:hypothetical protein
VGRDAGSFDAVTCRCEIVLSEMHLGLNDCKFVLEVAESVVLAVELLDFGGGVPVVEVGDGAMESVEGGSGTVEEGVEPNREWLSDVL